MLLPPKTRHPGGNRITDMPSLKSVITQERRRTYPIYAKVTLVLGSTVFALGIAEITSRAVGWAPDVKRIDTSSGTTVYQRSSNPILGFELKPSHRDPEADLAVSYPSTNAHGQRDVERSVTKAPGIRRIILLGDSVVEGHGIHDLDDTMSRQLERLYGNAPVEVLNFGVSGYCTLAEVEMLQVKGLRFQPDVVIVLFVSNDFDNFNKQLFPLTESPWQRPGVIKQLFHHSHLFRTAAIRMDLFGYGAETDPVGWNNRAIGKNNVPIALQRLRSLANEHGFQTLIAIWPKFEHADVADVHLMPDGEELVIERLARLQGFPTHRLSQDFRHDMAASPDTRGANWRYTVGDTMHPSINGCRVAAVALHRVLGTPPGAGLAEIPQAVTTRDEAAEYAAATMGKPLDRSAALANAGWVAYQRGDYETAMNHYLRALEINPNDYIANNHLGGLYILFERKEEALERYTRAIRIDPTHPDAYSNRGIVFWQMRRFDAARADYDKAIELDPDHANTFNKRGVLRRGQGDYAGARDDFTRAMALNPSDVACHSNLAWLLATCPDPAFRDGVAAVAHAENALKLLGGPDHNLMGTLATAHAEAEDFAQAIAWQQKLINAIPPNAPPKYRVANIARLELFESGQPYREVKPIAK